MKIEENHKDPELTDGKISPSFGHDKDFCPKIRNELIGANILNVGFVKGTEGGIAFDYIKNGETKKKRICVGYNELGEWIEFIKEINE